MAALPLRRFRLAPEPPSNAPVTAAPPTPTPVTAPLPTAVPVTRTPPTADPPAAAQAAGAPPDTAHKADTPKTATHQSTAPQGIAPHASAPRPAAPQTLGLSSGPNGPALAGAPLLRKTDLGFAPLPEPELAALTLAAYGEIPDLTRLTRGLAATARALNGGDLPLAMIGAVHLQLPDVSAEGAARLTAVAEYLAKRDGSHEAKAPPC